MFKRIFGRTLKRMFKRAPTGRRHPRNPPPFASPLRSNKGNMPHALSPPQPPQTLDVATALDPSTPSVTLWRIARERSDLRKWLIANPAASPQLLEYISQAGGDKVTAGLTALFENLEGT